MFPVEVRILEYNEDVLTAKMIAMREWLDHQRFEPATFRYNLSSPGVVFRIDFAVEMQAVGFAKEFGGRVISLTSMPP
jgi:hypothetical protein